MRSLIGQSLCFLLYCLYASAVDIPSDKLACITLAKYAEYDCTGAELGIEKYTTYSEPGHSECKDVPDEKTGMTLFTTNNEYCDFSDTGSPSLRQTWYLFDQQKDCTPFLGLQIFQLEQMFSSDSCILGGKTKFVSCVAGSCDNESLPDYTSGSETVANTTEGGNVSGNVTESEISGGNVTGNATEGELSQENVTGNATDGGTLPPSPDTSLGKIKVLCSEKYIQKHNDSNCWLVCEPGMCCFDVTDSCANNTKGCALYEGCKKVLLNGTEVMGNVSGNTTEGETSQVNMTDVMGNVTGNATEGELSQGNVTGNATDGEALPPCPDTSLGKIKVLCSEKYIQKHNDSNCWLVCEPGMCCFDVTDSCANNTKGCALYEGCEKVLLNGTEVMGNVTGNTTEGETSQENITGNATEGELSAGNITGNFTESEPSGGNATGNSTEGPSPPDASLGKVKVLCSEKYIQKHNDSNCLMICKPGACCFTETDSCSKYADACALYDGCQSLLLNATDAIGNETDMNATESVANDTAIEDMNSTESSDAFVDGHDTTDTSNSTTSATANSTASGIGNPSNSTDLNATSPAQTGNASLSGNGTVTGANSRPPIPDNARGGPEVVCSTEFRKEHKNGICRKTCEPGACCFSETDSCSSNTETCALYALCKPVLMASGRFLYYL